MNPPPYQPYGVRQPPPQQQQQPAPGSTGLQQQAPLSNSFRPFNPAQQQQVNVPYQQQGPPSSGGNRGGPAGFGGQPSQGMGGPPRGFVPPTGPGFSGPSSQPGAQPSMQFQPPQNAPGSFQGRPSGPPAAQPTPFQPANGFQRPNGISGPPSFGNAAAPPMMRGPPGPPGPPIGPPTGPPTGPPHQPPMGLRGPPGAGGPALNQQFAQMGLGGPPTSAPPMGGPPGPPTGPPTGPSTGLAPPGVPTGPPGPLAPLRGNNPYTPSGPPMMNAPSAGGPGKPYAQPPSGNFQQPPEMMGTSGYIAHIALIVRTCLIFILFVSRRIWPAGSRYGWHACPANAAVTDSGRAPGFAMRPSLHAHDRWPHSPLDGPRQQVASANRYDLPTARASRRRRTRDRCRKLWPHGRRALPSLSRVHQPVRAMGRQWASLAV